MMLTIPPTPYGAMNAIEPMTKSNAPIPPMFLLVSNSISKLPSLIVSFAEHKTFSKAKRLELN
jgi:hypothetical protein